VLVRAGHRYVIVLGEAGVGKARAGGGEQVLAR